MVFYANVIIKDGFRNDAAITLWKRRRLTNRKHAAEIRAIFYGILWWYRLFLRRAGENPLKASRALILLSNCNDNDCGENADTRLTEALRIPDDIKD